MAPTQAAGGSAPDPAAGGASVPDAPEMWGIDGMVGEGRYRLTRRLGRGGMAEVFAAEDVRLGRTVAVKLLRSDLAEDSVAKARFTREAQSVAGLNHHAVVAVYDSGEDVLPNGDTVPFMVMEYVEGRTIRDLLVNAEAPPVDQALIIVSGVLEALAYSHHHGIVHRDIKPANVIITAGGAVKVMDFGIARALHGAASTMTQTGMVMGTPQYLSPEQALGRAVDARSDLYATGCLLYELLCLRPPFTGETPLSVVYQHVQDDPKVPSEISDRVPRELDGLVLRSLAKEPDDRYQSAEEMRGEAQYALRMLAEVGANTGTWGTGHGGATPPMGVPEQRPTSPTPTTVRNTAELGPPLLLGPPAGGGPGGRGPGRGAGPGRWRKAALLSVAAVLAAGAGIFAAVQGQDAGGGSPGKRPPTQATHDSTEDQNTAPDDGAGTDTTPTDDYSSVPQGNPSYTPSTQPSATGGSPTTRPSTGPTGSTDTPQPTGGPTEPSATPTEPGTSDPPDTGGSTGTGTGGTGVSGGGGPVGG